MTTQQRIGLFLTVFLAHLLLQSRELPWNDGRRIWQVAESIAARGAVDVPPSPAALAHAGKHYAVNPLLPSVAHVPGAFLYLTVARVWPEGAGVLKPMASHLGPAALAALACLLFALLCRDHGVSPLATNLSVLVMAFATMVGVYARSPWSEISQVATFTGFFLYLLRARSSAGRWNLLWLGLWAGLVVNTKAIYILALPGAVAYLAPHLFRTQGARGLLRAVGWVLLGALPGLVMMLAYNQVRTGSFTNVGYALPITGATTRSFSENVFFGLYGLFLSPGKSLFLYSPPLLASLLALPRAWKTRERGWLWATLLTAGPVVYYNGTYLFWSGDWCWGPRYILFLVPMLLLPLAFLLDDLLAARRKLALAALGALVAAGVFVQVLGGLFYWDHFIRISQDARNGWLGNPNRSGAASADRGGMCDPCFEDFYGFNWLPAFTPIEGHWWLLRHVPGKHDWRRAEADAPWHRYTTLQLNIAPSYSRARLDWWFLDWKGPLRAKGVVLLILLALGVGASSLPWWRGHRAGRRAGPGAHDGPAAEAPPVSDARS